MKIKKFNKNTAIKHAYNKEMRYENQVIYCYDERPLYENYGYNVDDEIMKLVEKFKQLPL